MIKVICPWCQAALSAPDEALGQKGKCKKCGQAVLLIETGPVKIVEEGAPRRVASPPLVSPQVSRASAPGLVPMCLALIAVAISASVAIVSMIELSHARKRLATLEQETAVRAAAPSLPSYAETIDARCFRLVDDEGRVRGVLGTDADGKKTMLFLGGPETDRGGVFLGNPDGMPEIGVFVPGTKGKVFLSADPVAPGLKVMDTEGIVRVVMAVLPEGQPGVVMFNEKGKPTWMAP